MSAEVKLGSETKFEFSQTAILNINRLIKFLKLRLASNGKLKSKDKLGNITYVDHDIFSTDSLVGFLILSLSDFNQTPSFTYITFDDTKFIEFFTEILVSGACLYALASQALLEKGREFQITDNGMTFDPPSVSEMLETQYKDSVELHWNKVKLIKTYIAHFNA